MAHELEIRNGKAKMFSVRQVPWHGLGEIVENAPTVQEAITLAGLDWEVAKKDIYHFDNDSQILCEDYKAIVRLDTNETLSIKSNSYTPLQNKDAFAFFNPFVESELASLETAGSLRDGRIIWVLANLNKAPIDVGGGDLVNKYLLLSNSHDGTMAVRVGFTPTRVVCNNTLTAAVSDVAAPRVRIFHGKNVKENLDKVQEIVNAYDATFTASEEQYKYLAKRKINKKDLETFVNVVFKLRPTGDEREQARAKIMQEQIVKLFETGAGSDLKSAKGTYWGAYNAVTEYLTHDSGANREGSEKVRLHSNWFGSAMTTNQFAFAEATRMAAV